MPECGNCGKHVSMDFHRVFADPETGETRACTRPECRPLLTEYGNDFSVAGD